MKILHLAAARPNFMKVAPLFLELMGDSSIEQTLVHTGQHYDPNLSDIFFKQLNLPPPSVHLQVSEKDRLKQILQVRERLAQVITDFRPDYTIVVGDVNSTLGGALAAKDTGCKLVHVEAGLRSFDKTMPEEINRIATDEISDILFVTEQDGLENLKKEGVKGKAILVGNMMIDSLVSSLPQIERINYRSKLGLDNEKYLVSTFHRPANVDKIEDLLEVIKCIEAVQSLVKIVLPLHPRTKSSLEKHNLLTQISNMPNVLITEPLGYFEFMSLILTSTGILTDSGGIQEESTFLKLPCLTVRESTERPVTVKLGSNQLLSRDPNVCRDKVAEILSGKIKESAIPPYWDGQTAGRIKEVLLNYKCT